MQEQSKDNLTASPTTQIERRHSVLIKLFLFIVSPFLVFIYSLFHLKSKYSLTIIFLTCILFGLSFTIDRTSLLDGARYRIIFERTADNSLDDTYRENMETYLDFGEESLKDPFILTLIFIISRFTDNYHVFFMFVAIIFAYFQIKSLKFFTEKDCFATLGKITITAITFTFLINNSIFNISNIRFPIASWILVYSLLNIYTKNDKRYFWLVALTPLIHFAFFTVFIVLFLAYFTSKYNRMWTALFILSFFISNISTDLLLSLSSYLPGIFQRAAYGYAVTRVDMLSETFRSSLGNFAYYFEMIYRNALFIIIILRRETIQQNNKLKGLFSFFIVFITFYNFLMPIPDLGSRFIYQVAIPLSMYICAFDSWDKKLRKILWFLPVSQTWSLVALETYYAAVTPLYFLYSNVLYIIYRGLFVVD